jgi:hypothetical protein
MADIPHPPELDTTDWFNVPAPLTFAGLRGQVVLIEAFQMLCPGCVQVALPQLTRIYDHFDSKELAVIGLHSVFEHHDVMTPAALEVFIHEFQLHMPIAVDRPNGRGMPHTMLAYAMRGTPTLLLFDRQGRFRKQGFGHTSDLALGAELALLMQERHDRGDT